MCYRKKLPVSIYLFLGTFIFALILLVFSPINFNSLRDVANYFAIFCVTLGTYLGFCHIKKLSYPFFVLINVVWLFVGAIQTYVYPYFMTFLLNGGGRGIDSESRGVTSLATEPSQYGTIILILITIAVINYPLRRVWWLIVLLIFQLLLLAQSATALLVLAVAIGGFLLVKFLMLNRKALIYGLVVIVLGYGTYRVTYETLKEQRIYQLLSELTENPKVFLAADGSVSERFMFAFYSFKGMVDNKFLPRGYNKFNDYMQNEFLKPRTELTALLLYHTRDDYTRILCSLGSVFFQLGIFGIGLPIGIIACFRRKLFEDKYLFTCILIISILMTAFALMTATLGFLLGNALYLTRNHANTSNTLTSNQIK